MQQAIGYIRVSTQGQADEGVSLEAQRERIAAWCLVNGYELVDVFTDAGISGKAMHNRDGLQQALQAAGKGSALVCYSLSRLTRSLKDMLDLGDQFKKKGIDLVSLSEHIDTTTAAGKMIFQMLGVLNEFERNQAGERTKAALAHKKSIGEQYGPVPFGFEAIEGRLAEVKTETTVVAEILRQRESGETYRAIASDLNNRGIEGKRGGQWHASTVRYLIQRQAA